MASTLSEIPSGRTPLQPSTVTRKTAINLFVHQWGLDPSLTTKVMEARRYDYGAYAGLRTKTKGLDLIRDTPYGAVTLSRFDMTPRWFPLGKEDKLEWPRLTYSRLLHTALFYFKGSPDSIWDRLLKAYDESRINVRNRIVSIPKPLELLDMSWTLAWCLRGLPFDKALGILERADYKALVSHPEKALSVTPTGVWMGGARIGDHDMDPAPYREFLVKNGRLPISERDMAGNARPGFLFIR